MAILAKIVSTRSTTSSGEEFDRLEGLAVVIA
jgi:hypothetical protein